MSSGSPSRGAVIILWHRRLAGHGDTCPNPGAGPGVPSGTLVGSEGGLKEGGDPSVQWWLK